MSDIYMYIFGFGMVIATIKNEIDDFVTYSTPPMM